MPSLNGLRAASVLLVMVGHFGFGHVVPGGFGVTVFFFISGFLITRLLLAERATTGTIGLGRFYARRLARLVPALVVLIALVTGVRLALALPVDWPSVVAGLFYVHNYLNIARLLEGAASTTPMPFAILWSLAVEEHFYLLFPLVLLAGMRTGPGRALACVGVGLTLALALRLANVHLWHLPPAYNYWATETRIDSILFGCLLSLASATPGGRALLLRLAAPGILATGLGLLLVSFIIRDDLIRETWRYSLQGLGLCLVLPAVLLSPALAWAQKLLNHPLADVLGRLSYSLYLWHIAALQAVRALLPDGGKGVIFVLAMGVSLVLALASYHGVERRFLGLRRRFGSHDLASA